MGMNKNTLTGEQLLAALSKHLKVDLQLENGVCALFNRQGLETCVIELLPQNSAALLHCAMQTHHPTREGYSQLLTLNFQLEKMHGCWLALDDNGEVRLCAQCPMEVLTEDMFCQWVSGFVHQVEDMRRLLLQPI